MLVAGSAGLLGIDRRRPHVSLAFRVVRSAVFGIFVLDVIARIWWEAGVWYKFGSGRVQKFSRSGAVRREEGALRIIGGFIEGDGTAAGAAIGASQFGGGGCGSRRSSSRAALAVPIVRGEECGEFRDVLKVPGGRCFDHEMTG